MEEGHVEPEARGRVGHADDRAVEGRLLRRRPEGVPRGAAAAVQRPRHVERLAVVGPALRERRIVEKDSMASRSIEERPCSCINASKSRATWTLISQSECMEAIMDLHTR